MAVDNKYGKVTVELTPGNPLGDDEPVIIFRARDCNAVEVIDFYYDICRDNGSPPEHLGLIIDTKRIFENWQTVNADLVKIPD